MSNFQEQGGWQHQDILTPGQDQLSSDWQLGVKLEKKIIPVKVLKQDYGPNSLIHSE